MNKVRPKLQYPRHRDIELPPSKIFPPLLRCLGRPISRAVAPLPLRRPRWFFQARPSSPSNGRAFFCRSAQRQLHLVRCEACFGRCGRAEPDSVVLTLTHRVKACHFIAGVKSKIGAALKEMYDEYKGLVADTPMRRLRKLNTRHDVTVWAKLEGTNLGGSVKDRAALAMITEAERAGHLKNGRRLVEATSGNTGIALAMIATLKKLPITLLLPASATPERRAIMKAYGAEVILVEDGIVAARDLAQKMHDAGTHFQMNQFANPANPQMHYETTGPEVWRDTKEKVTHFVSSMGTTGTIMGTSKYLKSKNSEIQIVGVQPADGSQIPGIRRWPPEYLPKIYEPERVDDIIDVSRDEAEAMTRDLAVKEGLFVGLSSGGACQAALSVAQSAKPGSEIVFIVCDRGDKYLSIESLFPS